MDAKVVDVLNRIKHLADIRAIRFTRHGRERADERGANFEDVREALMTASTSKPDGDKYKVEGGRDLDGDSLTVVVAIEEKLLVVTLF